MLMNPEKGGLFYSHHKNTLMTLSPKNISNMKKNYDKVTNVRKFFLVNYLNEIFLKESHNQNVTK